MSGDGPDRTQRGRSVRKDQQSGEKRENEFRVFIRKNEFPACLNPENDDQTEKLSTDRPTESDMSSRFVTKMTFGKFIRKNDVPASYSGIMTFPQVHPVNRRSGEFMRIEREPTTTTHPEFPAAFSR